jgi:hypothetical protein
MYYNLPPAQLFFSDRYPLKVRVFYCDGLVSLSKIKSVQNAGIQKKLVATFKQIAL